MKSKKVLSIVISAAILFSSAPSVFADSDKRITSTKRVVEEKLDISNVEQKKKETKISEEEAKNIAIKNLKENFGVEIDEELNLRAKLRESFYGENNSVWSFNWFDYNSKLHRNISVSIDTNSGKILNVYINKFDNDEKKKLVTLTIEDAEKIAVEFLNKINSEERREVDLKYADSDMKANNSTNYSFVFARKINGVEILGNKITVGIDGSSGKIISYACNWDENVIMPSRDGVIGIQEAKEQLEKNIDMHLYYDLIEDRKNNDSCGKLIYTFDYRNGFMLDAKSGKMIDSSINFDSESKAVDLSYKEKEELYKIAAKNKEIYKKDLSREQAEAEAEEIVKGLYGSDVKIESLCMGNANYYKDKTRKIWEANFANEKRSLMGDIEIDAKNGRFLKVNTYYRNDDYENFEPVVTFKEAHKNVLKIIAKYFPEKIKNIDTKQMESIAESYVNGVKVQSREYYFSFQRVENGIEVTGSGISAEIDIKTGKLIALTIDWDDDVNLPNRIEAISKEEAKRLLTEKYEPVLRYTKINTSNDEENPIMEGKLIYQLDQKPNFRDLRGIDAVTHEYVDYKGNEIIEDIDSFENKISLSKYEKEITLLANSGIIDTKTFELNSEVSRIDLIKMLVNTKGDRRHALDELEDVKFKSDIDQSDDNYQYLQLAVYYGFIDNESKEIDFSEKLNREETAKILVKALGYEKLSKAKNYFVIDCKDADKISDDAVGSAAICRALGIMELDNEKFEPKKKITMEELSKVIYNMLTEL